eukprot:m.91577 g.91577  ORF g.91577 m.91577 type:complete len:807 (-) comp13308_c0_seq5:813-3233(-)
MTPQVSEVDNAQREGILKVDGAIRYMLVEKETFSFWKYRKKLSPEELKATQPKQVEIKTSEILEVTRKKGSKSKQFEFKVKEKLYKCKASSKDECEIWISHLNLMIQKTPESENKSQPISEIASELVSETPQSQQSISEQEDEFVMQNVLRDRESSPRSIINRKNLGRSMPTQHFLRTDTQKQSRPKRTKRPLSKCNTFDGLSNTKILKQQHFLGERFENVVKKMNSEIKRFLKTFKKNDSFVTKQLHLIAKDLIREPQEERLCSTYFVSVCESLGKLLSHEQQDRKITELLLIIGGPARIAECLEQNVTSPKSVQDFSKAQELPRYIETKLQEHFGSIDKAEKRVRGTSTGGVEHDILKIEGGPKFASNGKANREDFKFEKLISSGNFGSVYVAKHVETNEVVAIKAIPLASTIHKNIVAEVTSETSILRFANNPFVVGFYGSFERDDALFIVMEFVTGGDLATMLENICALEEGTARQYFAEIVLAVEYIHEFGITHRDLKPDNVVITSTGHVKLTDFGLSETGLMASMMMEEEQVPRDVFGLEDASIHVDNPKRKKRTMSSVTGSAVGTPGYMAPELILGLPTSTGAAVDWWAMGVMLYEMLTGTLPFTGNTVEEVFQSTVHEKLEIPPQFQISTHAMDLIRQLLVKHPEARLGTRGKASFVLKGKKISSGANAVKAHPFFSAKLETAETPIDWGDLLNSKVEFVPALDDELDTSYFDTRESRYKPVLSINGKEEKQPVDKFHEFIDNHLGYSDEDRKSSLGSELVDRLSQSISNPPVGRGSSLKNEIIIPAPDVLDTRLSSG